MPILLKRLLTIIILQFFIYSFFTEWLISFLDNIRVNFYLEFIILIFLFLPLLLFRQIKGKNIHFEMQIKNALPFSLLYLILPLLHFLILIKYEIFNRRIGTETISLIYGDMNGVDKFIMRTYDFSQFAYLIICFYVLRLVKFFKYRSFFKFIYLINFCYIIIFSLINSRASLIIFLVLFYIIDGLFFQISKNFKRNLFIISVALFFIASGIRYMPQIIINNVEIKDIIKNELLYRANCSNLLNEVYETTKYKGFLYGETISTPFLSIRAIMGSELAKDKIRNAETGSKQYILSNYLNKDNKDDCSCTVVDSYVNFGIFGIILLSLIYLTWIYIIYKLIYLKNLKSYHLLMIILFTSSLLIYENDGFSLLFSFFKFIPIIILYIIFNPIALKRLIH